MRVGLLFLLCVALSHPSSAQLIPPGLQDSIDALTKSITQLQGVLGTTNGEFDKMTSELSSAANSLQTLANFSSTVQHHQTQIIFSGIGILAGGIFIGVFSANYLLVPNRNKNLFYWIISGLYGYCANHHKQTITVEPLVGV